MFKEYKIYHSPGKILKAGRFSYVDQLKEDITIFSSVKASSYLMDNYGLKVHEYYNLITYGKLEVEILCPNCGSNSMKFKGLTKGWSIYCSQSCITSYRLKLESEKGINPFQNKKFIDENKIRVSNFQRKRMAEGKSHLLTKECQLKASRNNFIKNHVNDICYFYICRIYGYEDVFKIGICSTSSPSNRLSYKSHKLYNHHILIKSNAKFVADLEYEVKLNLCESLDEIIPAIKIKDLFKLIRNYSHRL